MKLPDGDKAIIDQRKIIDYSLSPHHDDGKHKARLFQDVLGLTRDHATVLLDALKEAAVDGEAVSSRLDRYGQRYVIDFEFVGPTGQAMLRSAWIIRPGETAPRLVTCYIL
jgi:Domain of unknown function (DUF6883)